VADINRPLQPFGGYFNTNVVLHNRVKRRVDVNHVKGEWKGAFGNGLCIIIIIAINLMCCLKLTVDLGVSDYNFSYFFQCLLVKLSC
jgi:hypothetical protein